MPKFIPFDLKSLELSDQLWTALEDIYKEIESNVIASRGNPAILRTGKHSDQFEAIKDIAEMFEKIQNNDRNIRLNPVKIDCHDVARDVRIVKVTDGDITLMFRLNGSKYEYDSYTIK